MGMFAKIEKSLINHHQVGAAVKVQNFAKALESCFCSAKKREQQEWIQEAIDVECITALFIQLEQTCTILSHDLEEREKPGALADMQKRNLELFQFYLKRIDQDWWFLTRESHEHQFRKPKGAYIRTFDLYAKGHLSYTQEEVQAACAAMGGCCAYDCGCCYKERKTHRMTGVFNHCVRWCICCVQRRQPHDEGDSIHMAKKPMAIVMYNDLRLRSN